MAGNNYTDQQLAGLARNNFGRWDSTIKKLIGELRAERSLNAAIVEQAVRAQSRLSLVDNELAPGTPRVLMIDCPGEGRCESETVVYADASIALYTARSPVGRSDRWFDRMVEAALADAPSRFRRMPGEIGVRERSIDRYPRDFVREVAGLLNAQATSDALDLLNELRERLVDEKNTTQPQGDSQAQNGAQENGIAQAGTAQLQEQETGEARTDASERAVVVPWDVRPVLVLPTPADDGRSRNNGNGIMQDASVRRSSNVGG